MKVCIETDQSGAFYVYQENEPATETMGGESPESGEQQDKQPARDLQSALMLAGKMLSGADKQQSGNTPFDEGLKSVLPQRQGIM